MQDYISADRCRMTLLRGYLDDHAAGPCGICDACSGWSSSIYPDPEEVQRAVGHLRAAEHPIEPRKMIPGSGRIDPDRVLQVGRVLSQWGDGGWSSLVRRGKQVDGRFDDRLVQASVRLIRRGWWSEAPLEWVAFVPSIRNPDLVADLAVRLAMSLDLECRDVVAKVRETRPQKTMQNTQQQYTNVRNAFVVPGPVPAGPVLLVDDIRGLALDDDGNRWLAPGGRIRARVSFCSGQHGGEVGAMKSDDGLATILLVSRMASDGTRPLTALQFWKLVDAVVTRAAFSV